jgi:hypothetical protein
VTLSRRLGMRFPLRAMLAFMDDVGGTIVVTRLRRGWRFFELVTVEIDGQEVGRLRQEQVGSYRVSPGRHFVRIRYRITTKSEQLMVQVADGSTVELECTHDRIGYPIMRIPAPPEGAPS